MNLLDLPPEIRLEIYQHVFSDVVLTSERYWLTTSTKTKHSIETSPQALSLLRVCRQLYHECNNLWPKFVLFHFDTTDHFLDCISMRTQPQLDIIRRLHVEKAWGIMPSTAEDEFYVDVDIWPFADLLGELLVPPGVAVDELRLGTDLYRGKCCPSDGDDTSKGRIRLLFNSPGNRCRPEINPSKEECWPLFPENDSHPLESIAMLFQDLSTQAWLCLPQSLPGPRWLFETCRQVGLEC